MKLLQITTLSIVAVLCAGCIPSGAPVSSPPEVADADFNVVWDAANEVLREYRFFIDRADRREGVITTFPMIGRHWFEFWRKDAATQRDVAEGTLQTLYRRVTINIRRQEDNKKYLVDVRVFTSRSDRLSPQVTSTSEAYDLFINPGMPRIASLTGLGGPKGSRSVSLGRDENLEQVLQREIYSLMAKKQTIYPK
ncbi:MAG: hypothetical protein KAV00_13680 [Phycisphaerae bacterium]|nr:hypothetical protein [Phycisphaerae bacterium]